METCAEGQYFLKWSNWKPTFNPRIHLFHIKSWRSWFQALSWCLKPIWQQALIKVHNYLICANIRNSCWCCAISDKAHGREDYFYIIFFHGSSWVLMKRNTTPQWLDFLSAPNSFLTQRSCLSLPGSITLQAAQTETLCTCGVQWKEH